jgi:hypothetical protein
MSQPNSLAKIRQLVQEINNMGGSYHKFDFGNNLVINGEYDMTKYLHRYEIPEDLAASRYWILGQVEAFSLLSVRAETRRSPPWIYGMAVCSTSSVRSSV